MRSEKEVTTGKTLYNDMETHSFPLMEICTTFLDLAEVIMETQKNNVQAQLDEVFLANEFNRLDSQLFWLFQNCLQTEYRVKEIHYYDERPLSMTRDERRSVRIGNCLILPARSKL